MLVNYDSVVSVTSVGDKYWIYNNRKPKAFYDPFNRLNRQDPRTNVLFYENGSIYMTKTDNIMNGSRIAGDVGLYEMPQERSHQIDSPYDLKVCEALLNGY
jgi:CMP-N-acetylneuraminic acid synthetase